MAWFLQINLPPNFEDLQFDLSAGEDLVTLKSNIEQLTMVGEHMFINCEQCQKVVWSRKQQEIVKAGPLVIIKLQRHYHLNSTVLFQGIHWSTLVRIND